ncbi:MAG: helix-turn-helix transcriptional regulator [Oscillospiraceae bacterium]|nr:helix-turn-helix transcriptional regulator [Oscillospiraceae bacterium]
MISYAPLWETMKKQNISTYTLIKEHNISSRTIHNLKHNKSITLYTMERLCSILHCQAESIVLFTNDKE